MDRQENRQPPYWRETKPRYDRRAPWHDYRSRCIYMITISKNPEVPAFSAIAAPESRDSSAGVRYTEIGYCIQDAFKDLCGKYKEISLIENMIMPDHLHVIVFVKEPADYPLGKAVGYFKGCCSRRYWQLIGAEDEEPDRRKPLFADGFHDRILMHKGQLGKMIDYVKDNPRRLWIKRTRPDLFRQKCEIKINGEPFVALGNLFLLRNMMIRQVRVSGSFSPEQQEAMAKEWLRAVEEGGCLVSPFISQAEKAYRDAAIEAGGNLILIEENGLSERFKPAGRFFDLCAEGRLLIIAPKEHRLSAEPMTRQKAMAMNRIAESIAAGRFTDSISLSRQ